MGCDWIGAFLKLYSESNLGDDDRLSSSAQDSLKDDLKEDAITETRLHAVRLYVGASI